MVISSKTCFLKLFVLSPQFSKNISLFFFHSLCPSSTNLLALFAYGHSLHGEWLLTSHLSEWNPPVILYMFFREGHTQNTIVTISMLIDEFIIVLLFLPHLMVLDFVKI